MSSLLQEATTPKSFQSHVRENLLLGLISLAPLVVTYWVLSSIVRFLDETMYVVFPSLQQVPNELLGFTIPGLGILVTLLLLFFIGGLAKTVAGKFLSRWGDSLLRRLPLVKGLYGMTKQISSVFFSQSPTSAFKKVVYAPFPQEGVKALAFIASYIDEKECFVFIPTAPNPTSGYVLKYALNQLEETSMSVEEALQMIISCGALGKNYESKIENQKLK